MLYMVLISSERRLKLGRAIGRFGNRKTTWFWITFLLGAMLAFSGISLLAEEDLLKGILILAVGGYLLVNGWREYTSDTRIVLDDRGMHLSNDFYLPWNEITGVNYEAGRKGGYLNVDLTEKGKRKVGIDSVTREHYRLKMEDSRFLTMVSAFRLRYDERHGGAPSEA